MAQVSEPVLFVIMDGGSGVKSSVIRAHAARRGHQRSRQRLEKAAAGDKLAKQGKQTISTPDQAPKTKARQRPTTKLTRRPAQTKTSSKPQSNEHERDSHQQQLVHARRYSQTSLQTWLPSFESEKYVSMFFETMMDSYTAAYAAFNVPNIIKTEWPLYMNHEVFLYTEAAAIQGLYDSLRNPTKPPSVTVLKYKSKALQSLKKELMATKNGHLDDYLVMSIFVLASLDLMAGDGIAHNAHKQILRTAFAAAGGLHTYGSFVRNTTMRLDSFWRSTPDEPTTPAVPLLAPSRAPQLPSHPFSPEVCHLIASLPAGFHELAIQRKIPLDVLEVLGRIANPCQKPLPSLPSSHDNRSPICSNSSDTSSSSNNDMYVDFWESCPSLSATSATSTPGSTPDNEPPLERLLSLALLIYATNRDATNPLRMYNCITNGAIYDLAHDLPLCEARRWRDEEHCLFWIWTVAVDANRDRFGVLSGPGVLLLEQQKARFPGIVGTPIEEHFLKLFWFETEKGSGSCLFDADRTRAGGKSVARPAPPRRESTRVSIVSSNSSAQFSDGAMSPGSSASVSNWGLASARSSGSSSAADSHGVPTPEFDDQGHDYIGSNVSIEDVDEEIMSVAASQWSGPGFGLLPTQRGGSSKKMTKMPELTHGRIAHIEAAVTKCVAA